MSEIKMEKDLSAAETLVMKAVWDAPEDIAIPDLIEVLRTQFGKDYARTTVVTFLQRLASKGYVTTYRKGRISYAHALREEEDYKGNMMKEKASFWYKGSPSSLMASLLGAQGSVEPDEIVKLREVIDTFDTN